MIQWDAGQFRYAVHPTNLYRGTHTAPLLGQAGLFELRSIP